jgi:hypothetical protein
VGLPFCSGFWGMKGTRQRAEGRRKQKGRGPRTRLVSYRARASSIEFNYCPFGSIEFNLCPFELIDSVQFIAYSVQFDYNYAHSIQLSLVFAHSVQLI